MNDGIRFSLVKPTIYTPFEIDFEWWKSHDQNWRVYLVEYMCPEHKALYENYSDDYWIDWVDPETAEIKRVDGLQHTLIMHCAKQPGFLNDSTTLVNAVFRIFLSNGNRPTTPLELSKLINKNADTILKTLAGPQVYKGIRPSPNE